MKRNIILFLCIIYTASASSLLSNYLERTNLEENNNNVLESVISNSLERKQKHNLLSSIEGDLLTSAVNSLLNKVLHKKHELRTGKKTRFRRPGFKIKNKILGNKRKRTSYKFSKPKLPLKVRKPKRLKVRNPKLSKHKRLKVRKPVLSKHEKRLKVRKPKRLKDIKPVLSKHERFKVKKPELSKHERLKDIKPVLSKHERFKVKKPELSKHEQRFKVKKPELSKHTHQLKSSHKRPDIHLRK